jgi:hypothetical protein
MIAPAPHSRPTSSRDGVYWAQLATATLTVGEMPREAVNLNVEGHRVVGPLQGFGPLWKKTFRVRLAAHPEVAPAEVVRVWKAEFAHFWPRGQRFYASPRGIVPGEVALLNLRAGLPLETGMLVLYADDESFTLMTPQGHMYASWITFSAYRDDGACTIAQVQMLLRSGDPIFEVIMHFGGFRLEAGVWQHTLRALARRFAVDADVQTEEVCLDRHVQWAYVPNIWCNSGMWTAFYFAAAPMRWVLRRRGRSGSAKSHCEAVPAGTSAGAVARDG